MKLTLFFTDGFDWKIKTNRYAFPFHWAQKESVLVVEYPDFGYWRQPFLKKEKQNLYVFRMKKFFPFSRKSFFSERASLLVNLVVLRLFILPLMLRASVKRIWMFYPTVFGLAKLFWPQKAFVYQIVDELSEYRFWYQTDWRRKRFKKIEKKVIGEANFVFTSSMVLYEKAKLENKKTFYLGNGAYVNELLFLSKARGESLRKFKRPICGFVGGMDNYRFDRRLLAFLAESLKDVSFVIIGPTKGVEKIERDNVYYLGYLGKKLIAQYLSEFFVGLMLYPKNAYSQAVLPVKLFEYFAFGLPVVTKNLPFTRQYKGLLYSAENNLEYLDLLKKALKEKSRELRKKRREIALAHDWTGVVERAYNVVNETQK